MTMTRDLLTVSPATPEGGTLTQQNSLLVEQSDYLQEIALGIRKQTADVLCTTVVKGTSQLSNAITDLNCHEVAFEIGGKPVEVYKILIYNTYAQTFYFSILSMSKINDGIPVIAGASMELHIPLNSLYLMLQTLSGTNCPVNGPTATDVGGIFVYGFSIPDYDRIQIGRAHV